MRRASFQKQRRPQRYPEQLRQEYRRHAGQPQVEVPVPGTPQQQPTYRKAGERKQ